MNEQTQGEADTPVARLETALAGIAFAVRTYDYFRRNPNRLQLFTTEVIVDTGDGPMLRISADPAPTEDNLFSALQNHIITSIGTSALVLTDVLDTHFGNLGNERDPNRRAIRIMAKELRHAFAHDPYRPRWEKFNKNNRGEHTIKLYDGKEFVFRTEILQGKPLQQKDVGGFAFWLATIRHCIHELQAMSREDK